MSEFALHTYSSNVLVSYPNNLDKVDVSENNYHIYMVHEIPRLSFVADGVEIFENHIELAIQEGVIDGVSKYKFEFSLVEEDHRSIFTYKLLDNNKKLIIRDNEGGGIETDVLSIYLELSKQHLKSKILYIGQSYGKTGERNAIQRLASHSTLQRILADTLNRDIEKEIAVTLWEFIPRLISSYDGISKKYLTSEEEDLDHMKKVFSAPPLWIDNQIINITEAALINYFKPEYNKIFKNNFPDFAHKGYRFYYDYDYNAITVELDPSCVNIEIFSGATGYSQFNPVKYQLHSEEDRRSMFDIEF